MKQLSDENIAKKKDKTISKHYTILVNGNKQKILNYKIRPALNDNNVKILELISKCKFAANLNTDKTISIVIDKGDKLKYYGLKTHRLNTATAKLDNSAFFSFQTNFL